jgi:hypothetical protein
MNVTLSVYNGLKAIQAGHEIDISEPRFAAMLCRLAGYYEAADWITDYPEYYHVGLAEGFAATGQEQGSTMSFQNSRNANLWDKIANHVE